MKIVIEILSDDFTLGVFLYPDDNPEERLSVDTIEEFEEVSSFNDDFEGGRVFAGTANSLSEVEATVEKLMKKAKYI